MPLLLARRATGVSTDRIFHKLNYRGESTRDIEIDRQTYRIMAEAFKMAREKIEATEGRESLVGISSARPTVRQAMIR